MLSIDIRSLVNYIVRTELQEDPNKNVDEGKALYFAFSLHMAKYTAIKSYEQRRQLHLVYHLYHSSCRVIDVFSAITVNKHIHPKDIKNWNFECSHDSCWADIKVFSDIHFNMAEDINRALKNDGRDEVAPINMSEHNMVPFYKQHLYEWIPVSVQVDEDEPDYHGYKKILTVY